MNVMLLHQRAKKMQVQIGAGNFELKEEQIELRAGCRFGVSFSNDKKHCLATLIETIESVESPENFFIEIEVEGEFETEKFEDEDSKREVHVESYYALFPYVQQLIAQLSMAAGVAPIMIRPEKMTKDGVHFGKEERAED